MKGCRLALSLCSHMHLQTSRKSQASHESVQLCVVGAKLKQHWGVRVFCLLSLPSSGGTLELLNMDHWHFIIGFTSCYASILWDFRSNVRFVHLYWIMALLPCSRCHVTGIYCIYMSMCQCQQNKHLHISAAFQSDLHNRRVWTAFMFVQQPAKVGQYEIERERVQ